MRMSPEISAVNIMIIDDDLENLRVLAKMLTRQGYNVRSFPSGPSALQSAETEPPDLFLLDIRMPEMDGFKVCARLKGNDRLSTVPVIFLSAADETEEKVRAFELGGADFISKPFQVEEVLARVKMHLSLREASRRLQELNEELEQRVQERTAELSTALNEISELKKQLEADNVYLQEEIKLQHNFEEIIGTSDEIKYALFRLEQVAGTDSAVIIFGETGTGKELVARALHRASPRGQRPLIKVNCAALPEQFIDSELFGHERGAYTGADKARQGRFELADLGTIFLDEIAELPLALQAKLLRVLQDGEFERLGDSRTRKTDARVIAATNRNLEELVRAKKFREDLWYRLNVFPITVPPLRDRKDDIPLLTDHFIKKIGRKVGKEINHIPKTVLDQLMAYDWPGNVRELEHVIERTIITSPGNNLHLLERLVPVSSETRQDVLKSHAAMEREHILRVLEQTNWVIQGSKGAASILELHPNTLRYRMQKLGIRRPTGKWVS